MTVLEKLRFDDHFPCGCKAGVGTHASPEFPIETTLLIGPATAQILNDNPHKYYIAMIPHLLQGPFCRRTRDLLLPR
jgi:hypothetical protein